MRAAAGPSIIDRVIVAATRAVGVHLISQDHLDTVRDAALRAAGRVAPIRGEPRTNLQWRIEQAAIDAIREAWDVCRNPGVKAIVWRADDGGLAAAVEIWLGHDPGNCDVETISFSLPPEHPGTPWRRWPFRRKGAVQ